MDIEGLGKLGAILLLVAGNAYFVGSEIALTSARRSRIKQLADMGNQAAKKVQFLHNHPERFYSVTQIGITLVSLALGAIGMVTLTEMMDTSFEGLFSIFSESEQSMRWAHTTSYAVAFFIISFLHVVAGELAPKVLAFHKAETISMAVAWSVNLQYSVMRPLIWIMNHASNGLLWVFGQRDLSSGHGDHFSMTEEEIRTIITASEGAGMLEPGEAKMIRGVFDLDEHTVREAMIPRTDILAVPQNATVADMLKLFRSSPHARFPVYEGSIDNIVGIIFMKEILSMATQAVEGNTQVTAKSVADLMNPPHLVPDTKPLSKLLVEFRKERQQMAIVVDEYGGTAGLITLEDILEEIVGEYDDEFTRKNRHIKKGDGSQYVIDASVRVSELEPSVNFPFPEGDYVTLAGLIYHELGRIPVVGDEVDLKGGLLKVVEMDNHRITKVLFRDVAVKANGTIGLAEEESKEEVEAAEGAHA